MLAAAARIKPFKVLAAARCLSLHGPTHEVLNQQTPLAGGYNLFSGDKALAESVTRWGGDWHKEGLVAHGAKMGCAEYMKHGELANRNPPVLKTHDANGRRVDTVEFHPSYHALMKAGIESGTTHLAWGKPEGFTGAHVARAALSFMQGQVDAGHGCPLTMTFAAVPAFRAADGGEGWKDDWVKGCVSAEYDPDESKDVKSKRGVTVGMSMTEKQGGSDVQTNTTTATSLGGDTYSLTGHKWFTSAPMCDGFITLARVKEGAATKPERLSCFLVPRRLDGGARNEGLQFQRLKDKLGDRSNASSEVSEVAACVCLRLSSS